MRIMIKGGVWKNTEDEILKAAVMKYGLNQWARISSLLVRKSAKQCKARWYEWLDPSIKKTEWTREEDEKLLHLAKLMPTQWRTIAPIVGRTPAQCLERYEKLLDAAAAKDDNYEPADDPRRLRPGEIDPNPEAKPARPDPMDMDEDEKEMLSEARARLANTKGKKAKRKAREKQLEEARRLASLQKKREMRAAGIQVREKVRKSKGIDYNAEVAFEHRAAPGFYDTGSEQAQTRIQGQEFRPQTVEEIEGRRPRDLEDVLVKKDTEHAKLKAAHNAPMAVAKNMALNDATMQRKRGRMMLPAPQISETELEAISRSGGMPEMDPEAAHGAGGSMTAGLLGNYPTPGSRFGTPMRTPRAEGMGGRDRILQDAQNLQKLNSTQTPLFGGENPELHASDFAGITPRNTVLSTPNPFAGGATPAGVTGATPTVGSTPGRSIAGVSSTPRGSVAGTPLRTPGGGMAGGSAPTPLRDELGLNNPDAALPAENQRAERARQHAALGELRAQFGALPTASNEYQIMVPELPDDAVPMEEGFEEDATDAAARRKAEAAAKLEAEMLLRSQVLQRGLPRPVALDLVVPLQPEADMSKLPYREAADRMLQHELAELLKHEAAAYPLQEKKGKRKHGALTASAAPLEQFSDAEKQAANLMLEEEALHVQKSIGHAIADSAEMDLVWDTVCKDLIFLPSVGRYGRAASATASERLDSVKSDFNITLQEMKKQAERAKKVENKVNLKISGLMERSKKLQEVEQDMREAVEDAERNAVAFTVLAAREAITGPQRRAAAEDAVTEQRAREVALQARYKALRDQLADLKRAPVPAVQQPIVV